MWGRGIRNHVHWLLSNICITACELCSCEHCSDLRVTLIQLGTLIHNFCLGSLFFAPRALFLSFFLLRFENSASYNNHLLLLLS